MIVIDYINNITSPIYYISEYNKNINFIVYPISYSKDNIKSRQVHIIKNIHDWYDIESNTFKLYTKTIELGNDTHAFGIDVPLFSTKIVPLDIDDKTRDQVLVFVKFLFTKSWIKRIDIISSSNDNWHIILGLFEPRNVLNLYNHPILCEGHCEFSKRRGNSILRISGKRGKTESDIPKYKTVFLKENDEWLRFNSNNIVHPKIKTKEEIHLDFRRDM